MSRRVIPSVSSDAPSGNSRSSAARNSGRSSIWARLRQCLAAHRWHPEQSVGGLTGRVASWAASDALVPGRGPLHVGDLCDGAPVGTRVAVAVEAPAHAERCHLRDRLHLVDATVAGDAADAGLHVRVVREVGVVGQLVDAHPAHRPAARGALANRRQRLAVLLHEAMAVHARLRGRDVRDRGDLDRGVAVPAVDPELAGVELVAVGDGLHGPVADVRVPGGEEVPDARDREHRTEAARDGGHDRELVPPGREYLGQRLGLRAGGQLSRPRVRDGTVMPHPRAPRGSPEGTTEILSIEAEILSTNRDEGQAFRRALTAAKRLTRSRPRRTPDFRASDRCWRDAVAVGSWELGVGNWELGVGSCAPWRDDHRLSRRGGGSLSRSARCGWRSSRPRAPLRSRSRRRARGSSGPLPARSRAAAGA